VSRSPQELLLSVAAGVIDAEVLAWLRAGAKVWLETDGQVPLERALKLPRGKRARIPARNFWLCQAYALCGGATPSARAEKLHDEIEAFRARVLPQLRPGGALAGAEANLSELRRALLRAFRQHSRIPDSSKQLQRIVGHNIV